MSGIDRDLPAQGHQEISDQQLAALEATKNPHGIEMNIIVESK